MTPNLAADSAKPTEPTAFAPFAEFAARYGGDA